MTGNNIHGRPEQGAEKSHLKPTEQPPAGTPITDKDANAVQQRQQEQDALKAFRLTKGDNPNPFTIGMEGGSEVQDKRPFGKAESQQELIAFKTPEFSAQAEKSITGAALIKIAEKLGRDPHRWEQTEDSPDPKCNQYVEAVLKAGHIPFPWKSGYSDCHTMREALDKECQRPGSKWEKVYVYDDKHGTASDEQFTHYVPKDGDVMIWDGQWGNEYVQHSGIAAEPYDILYAGSQSSKAPHGWAHGKITDFTQSKKHYGAPTAVYRYKGP